MSKDYSTFEKMSSKGFSPPITSLSWGRIEVGGTHVYKDAKVYPGGSRAWDWQETGTKHSPGIQVDDVRELVEHNVKTIVLACGVYGRLKVYQKTLEFLSEQGINVKILKTKEAVQYYNEQRLKEPIGALIHTTC